MHDNSKKKKEKKKNRSGMIAYVEGAIARDPSQWLSALVKVVELV
jgi:hypothetical protein